ncbi:MAG: VOC family protein [Acidobacteria bacterium]|nr:VOC family protein [Acidobacteriota bacterium]
MTQHGVNRIVVGTWDIEGSKHFFADLLGATFIDTPLQDTEAFGLRVSMAFDAGIELSSPLEGVDSALAAMLTERGEGIVGVVFAVEDADAAKTRAEALGQKPFYSLDYSREEIERQLGGAFRTYKEHFFAIADPLNATMLLGEFEPTDQ